jgi:hypothetical protein
MPSWNEWLRGWRAIADESTSDEYFPITDHVNNRAFEVLRISRYDPDSDADKQYVETKIREFNDNKARFSRLTMYLNIGRVITNKNRPVFVLEPGADAIEYVAAYEGVTPKQLVRAMCAGRLGRAVRSRDRMAAKNSVAQYDAKILVLNEELHRKDLEKAELEDDLAESKKAHAILNQRLSQKNGAGGGAVPSSTSGTMASPLGTASEGFKPVTNKPLPGSFGG